MNIVSASDGSVPSKVDTARSDNESQPGGIDPGTASVGSADSRRWQVSMRDAIRSPQELCRRLGLGEVVSQEATDSLAGFPVFVPLEFLSRIRPGDINDPLLRQVLPVHDETIAAEGFELDPVGDAEASLEPGLLQKYQGRALMVVTGACAVHCRYCFRRHFPYGGAPKSFSAWQPALDAVAKDESIHEILLSGGDPLTIVDSRLSELAHAIAQVPHVRRLRIHTRLPVMIPDRVNDEFLGWITRTRLQPFVVVHVNHAQELDSAVVDALRRMIDAGITVLNQAVLLRGVNDDEDALVELCEQLVDVGVVPYYLHQLDRVAGAIHFEVDVERGKQIVASMRKRLPGYAVPEYVREVAGASSKTPLR